MKELIHIAATLGLRIHAAHLPDGVLGYYSPSENRIYFDFDLTPVEVRTTIAHELGHAYLGHTCDSDANERAADTYAAQLLIHPVDYATAERFNPDPHAIADDLGITVELVLHYQVHCLQRIGTRTYGRQMRGRLTNELARQLT